ncbi:MAG: HD-like signal output (HDOD) protein [Pseudohongiellaceae bacterium]|jgi:HD-like signal output (HDOD) protein
MFRRLMSKFLGEPKPTQPKTIVASERARMQPLSAFIPFVDLPEDAQLLMINFSEAVTCSKGDLLFKEGDTDDVDFFLVSGKISIIDGGGGEEILEGGSSESNRPLSFLRPRQLTSKVASAKASFYQVPHYVVALAEERTRKTNSLNRDFSVEDDSFKKTLLQRIETAMSSGKLSLVSLPEVAIKVKTLCSQADVGLEDIADIIKRDSSMSIKLVEAANSPLYRGATEIKTVTDAVCRLGKELTQKLVFYFATKELFKSPSKMLDDVFRQAWDNSLRRAVMAQTVAGRSGFNPDIAFLCGLLFRIGDLLILQYVAKNEENISEYSRVNDISEKDSAASSQLVVSKWNLPNVVVDVLSNGGDWKYDSSAADDSLKPDYTDLMIVSNVLLRVMDGESSNIPKLDNIPAARKIINEKFKAEDSIINEYRKVVKEFHML